MAMTQLANSLFVANHFEDASSVQEAQLSMLRRVGASEGRILCVQGNLATTYHLLGRYEEAVSMRRDVYSGTLNLLGAENVQTLHEAYNIAQLFVSLGRLEEAKRYSRSMMGAARRVLGEGHDLTLRMRLLYAQTLYCDKDASLDDLREAVTTLAEIEPTARRVLGGAHPNVRSMEVSLQQARVLLRARESPPPGTA